MAVNALLAMTLVFAGCTSIATGTDACETVATSPITQTPDTDSVAAPTAIQATEPPAAVPQFADLNAWLTFASAANLLSPAELSRQRRRLSERFDQAPTADNRLRLAYLLSRPAPGGQNLVRSRELLAAIPPEHRYASLRDLVLRELELAEDLRGARNKVRAQQAQLEALKEIETDLTENQKQLEQLDR